MKLPGWMPLRSWRGPFIAVFVALQIFGPMHYYCGRRDKHDERFAWRMFSPMRMLDCGGRAGMKGHVRFTIDDRPAPLGAVFHEAWIEIANRGRIGVLERMGQRLCTLNPGKAVKVDLLCIDLDGQREERGGFNLCAGTGIQRAVAKGSSKKKIGKPRPMPIAPAVRKDEQPRTSTSTSAGRVRRGRAGRAGGSTSRSTGITWRSCASASSRCSRSTATCS